MRMICLLCLFVVLTPNQFALASEEDADVEQIKKLIPAAAAMSRKDFIAMATGSESPSEPKFEDKSLTLMFYTLRIVDEEDKKAKEEFQFLDDTPHPSELAEETLRNRLFGLATVIHADRITDITCEVGGDKAKGTVSFKVPDLYQGKVEYVAVKSDGKWKIVAFSMPARKIHIVRDESGNWKKK